MSANTCSLTMRVPFNAIHSLFQKSDKETEPLHGHNYFLEVTIKNEIDPISGQAIHRDQLKKSILSAISDIDKNHLNYFFAPATGENLILYIYTQLRKTMLSSMLSHIAIQETAKNRFELKVS